MRPADVVKLESVGGTGASAVLDRASSFEITNDLIAPAEALFEVGDDRTWIEAEDLLSIGKRFRVLVNGKLRLTGRMLSRSLPVTPDAGATVQLVIRTVLADAMYSSASPSIAIKGTSLKDAILAAYEPLGITEDLIIFDADVAVDLLTGKASGKPRLADLTDLKEEEAKVHPPETIWAFCERHLNRFHLSHWDAPDGRIIIGAPDDTQAPLYRLRCRWNQQGRSNNVLSASRREDYEQVPSILGVFGVGGGKEYRKAKVRSVQTDPVLSAVSPVVYRPVLIVDESVKTQAQAESRAMRELAMRSRAKDAWTFEVDGFSYWDGTQAINWAVDTVADVQVDAAAGTARGPFLVTRCKLKGDADRGYTAELECVAKGVWRI